VNENIPYDDAYRRSQTEIKKVIPMAEKQNIQILIENVWNKFLLSPLEEAQYLDELDSKWIGAYFDVGNVVNFGYPEQWIRILGHRVKKLDIKEYSREKRDEEGPFAGFRVPIGEGSVDWAAVRRALNDINYSGWATAEVSGGNRERLQDIASRMNQVLQMS
jgi:hexulose-6-phosphate isomerase